MMRRLPLFAALTAATLVIAGCAATTQISLDPQVRQRSGEMREIRAVHYDTPAAVVARSFNLQIEAPAKAVKDRFLGTVSQGPGLIKLEIIDQPRPANFSRLMAPPIDLLKRDFGRGLVFDFHAPVWALSPVYDPLWFLTARRYGLSMMVRARLIRLDDSTILWQQACLHVKPEGPRTLDEWIANDYALFRTAEERQAQSCADELVGRFLGK